MLFVTSSWEYHLLKSFGQIKQGMNPGLQHLCCKL